MSKNTIREDKTCLNCGTFVEERFCPQCGQENTETRKSFHYLFTHFVEDLVHYDSGFWKTMKYLLFYPAKLTREYLSGRRKAFVVPVKLYIFISFITFFLAGFFFDPHTIGKEDSSFTVSQAKNKDNIKTWINNDTIEKKKITVEEKYGWYGNYKNVRQLDSIENSLPAAKKMSKTQYWITRRMVSIAENNTPKEAFVKALQSFKQNLSKVLLLYMPVFTFWLWLFHEKKRWYYFDHGIFTLHYFSFLLLTSSLFIILEWLLSFSDFILFVILKIALGITFFVWPIIYFFKAHKRMYGETAFVSFLKCSLMFWINFMLVILFLSLYSVYSFISVK